MRSPRGDGRPRGRALAALLVTGACGFSAPAGSLDAAPADGTPVVFDPAGCPSTYREIAGQPTRYQWGPTIVPGTLLTWSEAQARCAATQEQGYQPHLVVFETVAERAAVWAAVAPETGSTWAWTGAYKLASGDWAAITGGLVTPAWGPGEPNLTRQGSGQHAIAYGQNPTTPGELEIPFDWYLGAICECDGRDVTSLP